MAKVTFFSGQQLPLEMHKVRIIQKLNLLPIEDRRKAMAGAGYNTFLLQNTDVFLDMLTDSGVNAMSDQQQAAMLIADDAYAGSATYTRLYDKLVELFGMDYFLPAHQGRAAEHILSKTLVKPGTYVPMNYHFTTSKAHVTEMGGEVLELITKAGLEVTSDELFKGNFDIPALQALIDERGAESISYVRIESGTNLIGGQPLSLANIRETTALCRAHGILTVLDASLLADNLYFNKTREPQCQDMTIPEITRATADCFDIIYFSARKLGFGRGGGICIRDEAVYKQMRALVPMYEGFLTYGGMSVREMEAITVGLGETMDEDMINQGPLFIEHMVNELDARGIPVITPAGGLGAHVDAMRFLPHVPQQEYPAGALAAALYIASGVRGMERGTLSEQRDPDGTEPMANMELVRLALPRRVFTLSQVNYAIDRIDWLYQNRELIGGLKFIEEPEILRFFYGRLEPIGDWVETLTEAFRRDLGDSL
ncbi:tryptophanase [Propionicimonas sp.]|uniref:tryptophanase n=1 Tax=Propionicimonas sp. TaxID=1955623 RepID=UPI0018051952|nr:tryptophanase [Propionicimonas sp.]MBU3977547.1 tryptophanase [Actinomycetota bacterium]MBA3021472.1 tryptophanase [Propionicimonas sp.]MBU3987021.1 tryptophanase [Actinomycetota bacterium]MBU4008842.1 tryptophanase [Actinomycetota bacterium]MBU4066008.1 tryptophanase [Actinomycetota bacterium]